MFVFTYTQSEELVQKEHAMILLSVIIEYFSQSDIDTYYESLNPIIENYLQSEQPSLKRLAVETVYNLTSMGSTSSSSVIKKYPNLIPLVLNAINMDDEDLIKKIFETLMEFIYIKKVMRQHLDVMINAALTVAQNTELANHVREVAITFVEELGEFFARPLAKKNPQLVMQIVQAGFKISCEEKEDINEEEWEDQPCDFALHLLFKYAEECPNDFVYPLFKENLVQCWQHASPQIRMAGLKILGFVSDPDCLLDPIKDDIDELTDVLVACLKDADKHVRNQAGYTVGEFAQNVVPEFLDEHEKVLPCLLSVITEQVKAISAGNKQAGDNMDKSLHALTEFC